MDKLLMYLSKTYRYEDSYLNKQLKKYNLSSGSFSYLLALNKNEGMSQIQISKDIGNDRAMSARTINKLIADGFVYKIQDEKDCRAYKLYLTDKGREIIPSIEKEIQEIINFLTEDLSEDEKRTTRDCLKNIFEKSKRLRNGECVL
ncbi:DNA-binding transcriptional regulator, MarR family [Clostridium sp. DSM 8431]|uniref:MarR family winged helix-turn-helix transcriptional regulator n=1 Tax=Clostridium sp. DSM 8431 TaxID=1761781 RepID=UPI0008E77414|nr:MarR family transcriptional regulator [Clostridium sp. DSM 8431]SFU87023.1 DNA-binding transcriptional regulator, MarR family [Clostridium sp. DSM 8431]